MDKFMEDNKELFNDLAIMEENEKLRAERDKLKAAVDMALAMLDAQGLFSEADRLNEMLK